jgi:hypothetical protein
MPVWQPIGRPRKTLAEHVRDGTFRPARHGHLLAVDEHQWVLKQYGDIPAKLKPIRTRYREASSARVRQAIALDFRDAAVQLKARRRRRR